MDDKDRKLFLKYLNILNDQDADSPSRLNVAEEPESQPGRNRLTDIVCFCLMDNHFHFLLHESFAGGISKFMQRLGTAYTLYFNEKYERSGALFQGRYKSKEIDDENYLMGVVDYIHCNPTKPSSKDVGDKKEYRIRNSESDLGRLEKYRWSSFHSFCNRGEYDALVNPEVLKDYLEMPKDYRQWLREEHDLEDGRDYLID